MEAKTFAMIMSVSIFAFIIELIRRQKMTFRFSALWLTASIVVLVFSCQTEWLSIISRLAGFALPSNFVFFMLLIVFIFQSLLLTIYINEQNSRAESLAQAAAALEYKMKQMEARLDLPHKH